VFVDFCEDRKEECLSVLIPFWLEAIVFHYTVVFRKGEGLSNVRSRDWIKGDDDSVQRF
jgi:hypothetical protein